MTCPAEGRRAAALDRAHYLELAEAEVTAVGVTPSGPVVAEDIRDLQGSTAHAGPALRGRPLLRQRQPIRGGSAPCAVRWWRRGTRRFNRPCATTTSTRSVSLDFMLLTKLNLVEPPGT
jgi:hypothetical protein